MTIHFDMTRGDVLALNQEYYQSSPTVRATRFRVQMTGPVMMFALWAFTTYSSGLDPTSTCLFTVIAVLWYYYYPSRFDRNLMKSTERMLDETSFAKMLGPCELVFSEEGLRSKSGMGESSYPWRSVERVCMTGSHVFIFLSGNQGYPLSISQLGEEQAKTVHEFALRHAAA